MTVIIGLAGPDFVTLAGDSAASMDHEVSIRSEPKVFRNGDFLIGAAGSLRMRDILSVQDLPALPLVTNDLRRWMITSFVEQVREVFKAAGLDRRDDTGQERGGTFLVGCVFDGQGRLFEIESDYQVGENADGYAALGTGAHTALGSLDTSVGMPTVQRVRTALRVAAYRTTSVRAPFVALTQHADRSVTDARWAD